MSQETYIKQLENEKEILQNRLNQIEAEKKRKKKMGFWLLKKSSIPLLGIRLKKSIQNAIVEYKHSKSLSVDTVADVSSNIIYRFTRIGIFAFFMTVVPSLILIFQTSLLYNQNKYINNQTSLIEADRRSSLVFLMGDVLGDLNEELKYKGSGARNISKTLEARIVSLCMAMKPYRYIDDGALIKDPISPERGQLLFSLLKSDLSAESSQDILNSADFHYTDLKLVNLGRDARLKYARLDFSDFSNAQMPAANLERAELNNAILSGINLSDATLKNAKMRRANLERAELLSADLTNTNLTQANLKGADLSEAKLWGTNIINANLEDVILDNAIVHRSDWLSILSDSLNVRGASHIRDTYKLVKQGKQQYLLQRK
ncbi:pentapeptide repeat-containing protein [Aquimarina intermedia]|uniref:Pentapeptide repeat protein n=1 Tax=Aquimarina intermedia TaxID=350814 RepID=A0A5S5C963_9FLAO|nr:pentapeptide repeat-containing protein [Aquimarina intermedia]TYP75951.1 pentapeptide repeat protein [Aquimarina intermedia]